MKDVIKAELDRIRASSPHGMLTTAAVIEAARSPDNPLHDCFTWDQKRGFEKNLVSEAQDLIQSYTVVIELPSGPRRVRQYVSLSTDRLSGGGYRLTSTVLGDQQMREVMLADALAYFDTGQIKFGNVKELHDVFTALDKVRSRQKSKRKVSLENKRAA